MRNKRFTWLLMFVAATWLTSPAWADLIEFESTPSLGGKDESLGWSLPYSQSQPSADRPADTLRILAAPGSAFRLNSANQSFPSALPDIGLWKFISTVRAQQSGSTLVLLESNLRILETSTTTAPIPLPAAAWFMMMGLLTLFGLRARGRTSTLRARRAPASACFST